MGICVSIISSFELVDSPFHRGVKLGDKELYIYNSTISRFIFLLVFLLQHMGGFYSFRALLTFGMSGKPNEGLET